MESNSRRLSLSLVLLSVLRPLVAAIVGIVIWQNYRKSVEEAIAAGRQLFANLQTEVALQQNALLAPVRVSITALAKASQGNAADAGRTTTAFLPILEAYPQLAALRVAYADGTMIEVVPGAGAEVADAAYTIRTVTQEEMGFVERVTFVDRAGAERGRREAAPISFDPRSLPWYGAGMAAVGRTVETLPYRILRSDDAGISAVCVIEGERPGVIAADIKLRQFSLPLESLATEPGEQMFLFTGDEKLFANTEFAAVIDGTGGGEMVGLNSVDTLTHPAARAIMAAYCEENRPFSTRRIVADGEPFLATVTRLGPAADSGERTALFFAFAMLENTFTGAFIAIGRDAALISLGIMALSIPLIVVVARRLARPLASLAEATDRIAQLDLAAPVSQPTRIREIARLGDSLDRMKSALGQMSKYVPKSLVQDLINSGVTADIGGDRREMSFMFTDVRDFTPMAESTPAEELMAQMSQYFDGLVFDILERGGTVDKYVGDAIFAYWNAPVRQHNHPDLACLAALACRATSNKLNSSFQDAGRNTWYTRLGVHLGEAVVGNVGSRDRMDYTVVGNAVNIASRLEGLNKFYGTQILASGQVVDRLGDRFVARFLDVVSPKGAGAPVRVFELLGTAAAGPLAATAHDRALCRSWGAIVAAYQCRDWTKARETVAAFAAAYPNDPVAGVFADRIEHFIAAPPPTEWDGVTRFESK